MEENIRKRVEHLAEIADLAVLAREMPVPVVGELGKYEKRNHDRERRDGKRAAVLALEPNWKEIYQKENRGGNYPAKREFVRSFHFFSIVSGIEKVNG